MNSNKCKIESKVDPLQLCYMSLSLMFLLKGFFCKTEEEFDDLCTQIRQVNLSRQELIMMKTLFLSEGGLQIVVFFRKRLNFNV